jgi:type IV pilus assembly protein PilA
MYNMNKQKGFTIIELLVVIAIVGILSTVILASIKSARAKNADAAAKASFQGVSPQAELYYVDNSYSFANVCHLGAQGSTGVKSVSALMLSAAKAQNLLAYGENNVPAASLSAVTCNNTASSWAVEVPMTNKDIGGTGMSAMFCVDSLGFVGYRSTSMGATANCPAS